MSLDLDETAQILTQSDGGVSIYLRAIRLFEFQICLYCPKAFSSKNDTFWQANARLLASLTLLEHLKGEIAANDKKEALSLSELAANPDYAKIFDDVIMKSGGWRRIIRGLMPSREFDEQIDIRKRQSVSVTKLVDFSYRFAHLKIKTLAKGGVTMARSIVSTVPSYKYNRGLSTLKSRWKEYGLTAGFLYLLRIQKFELTPYRVTDDEFAKELLQQAGDIAQIREFFQAYQYLCNILNARGYRFPTISSDVCKLSDSLAFAPFPEDVDDAIKIYKSAR
jgi:hypothetical protein